MEAGVYEVPALELPELNANLAVAIGGGAIVTALAPRESALEAEFHAAVGAGGGAPHGTHS
jgi:hypothetical protein